MLASSSDARATPRRILVTGATGTVGGEVVRALRRVPGVALRIATRAGAPVAREGAAEHVRVDFDAVETLAPAFEGVDAFFFVSPLVDRQVEQAHRVIAAAERAGVRHCVRLSSRATGWDESCVLRKWHREIEAALRASTMSATMLRPCSFMQNVLGAPLELARNAGVFSIPLGTGRIPFVDARDLGEAAAPCLLEPAAHAGATYVLTGAHALSGEAVARALAHGLGREVRYVPTPPEVARRNARDRGMPEWLVESGLRVYARAEGGDEAVVDPKLADLLGRSPLGFDAFVAREVMGLSESESESE